MNLQMAIVVIIVFVGVPLLLSVLLLSTEIRDTKRNSKDNCKMCAYHANRQCLNPQSTDCNDCRLWTPIPWDAIRLGAMIYEHGGSFKLNDRDDITITDIGDLSVETIYLMAEVHDIVIRFDGSSQ